MTGRCTHGRIRGCTGAFVRVTACGCGVGGVVVSIERDWLWALTARRFLWQASSGSANAELRRQGQKPIGDRVQVRAASCAVEPQR